MITIAILTSPAKVNAMMTSWLEKRSTTRRSPSSWTGVRACARTVRCVGDPRPDLAFSTGPIVRIMALESSLYPNL
jgi:hypothetical protein